MNLTRILTETLPVFKTFQDERIPVQITVASKSGDTSMLYDLPTSGLAVVGTRHPQKRSLDLVEESIAALRNTDLIIVSGFARGIDAKAHETAVQYGLRTIAVLGSGIEVTYPRENQKLRDSIIAAGGLVISQFADDALPYAGNFYNRNIVIAGFSKATWVVEAAEVSGTLNTASAAGRMSRDIYATSCFPKDHYYQGNVKLLSQRDTLKHPVANAFYSSESFSATWTGLGALKAQRELSLAAEAKTQIQRWVLELQTAAGECRVQTLMNHAAENGYTLGKFYQDFESEVAQGLLRYDTHGLIEIIY